MKGIFLSTDFNVNGVIDDTGYYIDGDFDYHNSDVEELVEVDEAYRVQISRDIVGKVYITLESANRKVETEIDENVGIRRRGLDSTFYHKDGDPVLPHHFRDREAAEVLTSLAKYALEHSESDETEVNGVDWDDLMDDENLSGV